jgi:hypothetical protein
MQFWVGATMSAAGLFAVGLMMGWWLRGKFVKDELRSVAEEMMGDLPDIWPDERHS